MATDVFNLQAKIGIDTSEYDKGIQGAENANKSLFNNLKSLSSVVKNAANSLGNAGSEYRKVGTAADGLSKGLENSTQSGRATSEMAQYLAREIDNLRQKQNESIKATNKAASEYNNLASSEEVNEQALESLSDEIQKGIRRTEQFASEIAKLENRLEKESKSFDENADSVEDAGEEAEETGNKNKKLGEYTKEAGEKAEKSGDRFSSFGDKIKDVGSKALSVASSIAKVGAAAVGLASAAIVKVTKDAVSAYGEYEQLVGGAQKIFDEMDYSIIAKDAANAYKELNMSASEYIESINLAGATFAQTMGDEKGYNTARKGMKAIADFASGTGKNITELNEKFQMITRASSSYQSIADQFSGILPQTSADFLAQAQAAGFLSDEYESLTDVPVAEYQEAVTNMLEKGVDALGLLNNTAAESEGTLTGSFAMVRAAWDNLVVGFADPDADLGLLIENFTESASAAFENLLPVIERAIGGISEFITTIAPKIAEDLPGIINEILPGILDAAVTLVKALGSALLENAPLLLETGLQLLEDLLSYITNINNDPQASKKFADFVDGIGKSLNAHLPKILKMALDLMLNVMQGIIESLPTLIDSLLSFLDENFETIIESITQLIPVLIDALLQIVLSLAEWLTDNMDLVIDSILQILNAVVDTLISEDAINKLIQAAAQLVSAFIVEVVTHLPEILELGGKIIGGLFGGIWEALTTLTDPISEWLSDKLLELTGWIDDRITDITKFGSDFLESLKDSLSGNNPLADWLSDVLLDFTSWIDDRIKDITSFGTDLWTSLKDSLSGNNPIADWLSDVWIAASEAIGEWWDDVKQWGSDLIDNFVDGIYAAWDTLVDGLDSVADTIGSIIGFSEPKEGPLSPKGSHPFHTFAPDMIDLFVSGIKENEDKIQDQLADTFGMDTIDEVGSSAISASENNTIGMLQRILDAINAGRVIAIDGNKFVGATVNKYDTMLGEQIRLNERGLAYV
jgi:phage-related protein/predicted  nucleic acid-binding Zn-ribbon protein